MRGHVGIAICCAAFLAACEYGDNLEPTPDAGVPLCSEVEGCVAAFCTADGRCQCGRPYPEPAIECRRGTP